MNTILLNFDQLFNGCADWQDTIRKTFGLPFNVVKQGNDLVYELSLAGYAKEDIEVNAEAGVVRIKASKDDDEVEYKHKGLTYRDIMSSIPVPNMYIVSKVSYKDGLLRIHFSLTNTPNKTKITIED